MITLLKGPLLMTAQIFAVGAVWSPPLAAIFRQDSPARRGYAAAGAAALIAGLSINLLIVLLLGEVGVYRSPVPEAAALTAVLAGAVFCRRNGLPADLGRHLLSTLPAAAAFFLAVTAVTLLPARGEWVLGGWDPGVYVNEGIALERLGTFHPPDRLYAEALDDEGKAVFTRGIHGGRERFPGVVVDERRGGLTFEFFRLTPAWIALNRHLGGDRAAFRANGTLAPVALGLFAFLAFQAAGGAYALFALLILLFQPVLLYHTHVPASEMLQLTLLIALALLLPHRTGGRCAPVFLAFTMFLLLLNRFSFLPFAGLLLVTVAWCDISRPDRSRVLSERLLQLGACGAGAAADFLVAPASLRGWGSLPMMLAVFAAGVLCALILDGLGTAGSTRNRLEGTLSRLRDPLMLLALSLLVVTMLLGGRYFGKPTDTDNFFRLLPFLGPLALLGAGLGIIPFFFTDRRAPSSLRAFLLFLLAVTALLMTQKWVVDIYPWATRRYLTYTVFALSLLAAWPPTLLWQSRHRRGWSRLCAVIILLLLTVPILPRSRHAWSRVEHQGAARAAEMIARQTGPGDVIVVDSPRWGTPLALIHGREVLDGKHLWRFGRKKTMKRGLRSLEHLGEKGRRIRFLTSTKRGLAVYPLEVRPVTLDWESETLTLQEIIHGPRASDYVTRTKEYVFRLYTWTVGDG